MSNSSPALTHKIHVNVKHFNLITGHMCECEWDALVTSIVLVLRVIVQVFEVSILCVLR